ncbi:PPPDE peptidase, putative [Plasmodium knowlesi strain H]|uniref:PPPDE peptidase, putative n=3 Tax=Plasmodium knowlesi TaxID=5850 RepID=A0A1A7W6R1_PLAKH|nr:PPPDE peptidase, putative [Plasmodium knowlesi strain H]OTN65775.1 putative PPPDE peptidase [Plasmodium knowlesi]CAA9987700.1 PPPDE peptidase, putative [Plasmodium knowlesi strain H]SBO26920.1 PPPDE peptidase, putative [Plasmodium knowlesi strain H]SBO29622.1 PPPDE peptidase, putative [Plasmodium knowlesi strain H]VVS77174.1 PPPDE peptidase, putative [Plasmodium knowlesi strain H]
MKKKNRAKGREYTNKDDKNHVSGYYETRGSQEKIPQPDFNSSMVYLNIYDLDAVSKVVNTVARSIGAGAFHAGVEVYGYEYSFGYIVDGETGVTKTSARYHPYHVKTPLTKEEVDLLVEVMKLQWIGDTYDILSRNCLNYADYFCNLLDVGSIPEWVMSLQKKVTWVKSNINVAASKLKELNKAAGIPTVINFIKKKYNDNDEDYEGCKVIVKS